VKLYTYVLAHDTGFAPNPFWGICTLACCKPVIRRTAKKGDWVLGIGRKKYGNKLIYAMEVTEEPISYLKYFNDKQYEKKIPDFSKKGLVYKCGDNIYKPLSNGEYKQLESMHSIGEIEDFETKKHDLGGNNVLISNFFYYFGSKPKDIINQNKKLEPLRVGRAHKCNFDEEVIEEFFKIIKTFSKGVNAPPRKWKEEDNSWRN